MRRKAYTLSFKLMVVEVAEDKTRKQVNIEQ